MSFRDKVEIFRILITSNKQETEEDVFMDELENSIDLEIESADVKVNLRAWSVLLCISILMNNVEIQKHKIFHELISVDGQLHH